MNDEWDDFMPDSGDYGISPLEAVHDTVAFFAKVVGALLLGALVVGVLAYGIWKEIAIFTFLTGQ